MPAPQWESFAGVVLLVLAMLVLLARASQSALSGPPDGEDEQQSGERERHDDLWSGERVESGRSVTETEATAGDAADDREASNGGSRIPDAGQARPVDGSPEHDPDVAVPPGRRRPDESARDDAMTTGALLVNVAISQGLFGAMIVAAAWLAGVPAGALGVEAVTLPVLGVGVALGVALFGANELGQRIADASGVDYAEGLREQLTPESLRGWAVLLLVVLPIIAGFEELLFRGALIGALSVGFGVSPWLLAVGSTVAFALGHGAQGPGGVLVTGILGGVLAAAFVLTGSLFAVVVAHYLVNALEFVVHARD
ncbi:CPBP family intramembrane glutamic endopeptidase [Halomicrococcus gelatinilyticus]|uniref:CPBP family intramembrane glutamic endopeptidase n=1 Tax=Halomicrococcus gelatinilyticus TaxID=1702103 RepID=UPI002E0DFBB3